MPKILDQFQDEAGKEIQISSKAIYDKEKKQTLAGACALGYR